MDVISRRSFIVLNLLRRPKFKLICLNKLTGIVAVNQFLTTRQFILNHAFSSPQLFLYQTEYNAG